MITTAIVFDRRHKAATTGQGALEVRVIVDRVAKYYNTGIKVRPGEFIAGKIINRLDAEQLNERLQIIVNQVHTSINGSLSSGDDIDDIRLRKLTWRARKVKEGSSVADWIEQHIPSMGLKAKTERRYYTLVNRLREFQQIVFWDDLTTENIYAFNSWLHERKGKAGIGARTSGDMAPISDAGVHNYHKCFKASINLALRLGVVRENPYNVLKGEFSRGDRAVPDFLNEKQMAALQDLKFLPGSMLESAKELAIVQMFTGMAYADLECFDINKFTKDDNGRMVYSGLRVKTHAPYVVQLLPPVLRVLERHQGKLPILSLNKYNECLKVIGEALGLPFSMHSHALRHTYATWALRNKVPLQIVSRMMGHKSIAMTMRYAKILTDDVCQEFDHLSKVVG